MDLTTDATPPVPSPCLMSHGAMGLVGRHLQRAANKSARRQSVVVWTTGLGDVRRSLEGPHQSSEILAWRRRAPQGSGGRRRVRVSWILLARSLEETRRKGARGHSGVTWPHRPSSPPPAVGPMKTLWSSSSAALFPRLALSQRLPRRVQRAQSPRSDDAGSRAHCPGSSTCDVLLRRQEKPSPVHRPNAGAPSSELPASEVRSVAGEQHIYPWQTHYQPAMAC
ncbi:uncharacterized protein [Nerophis lumbriciformis]|uniref:uncharacterized protein isoform X1 n=1 Tax=Nerophis lumbriciformis TaxID=546530 RepID=UPI002ADFB3B6|nr:uncharacterized protein LOC133621261 isoform X1 [Nerophis lumbriciformis]